MKKQDPISGLTIDVPDQVPPLGRFPYSGFWAQIYNQVPSALEQRTGFSKFDISSTLNGIEGLANGPFSVIIGEKLWKVGELLSMNQYISASGEGGKALEYIQNSSDGGRIEIAAVCLEPIVNSLLQRSSLSGKVGEEVSTIETEYLQKLEQMRQLVMRMSELEESYFPLQELEKVRQDYQATASQYQRLQSEVEYVEQGLKMVKETNRQITQVSSELKNAEANQRKIIQEIETWQAKLKSGNGSVVNNASNRLTHLGKKNAQVANAVSQLGQQLMRLTTQDLNTDTMKNALNQLYSAKKSTLKELSNKQDTYLKLEKNFQASEAEMTDVRTSGAALSNQIEYLASKLDSMKNSQQTVVTENESELIRLWVNHLSETYLDAESYLFNNLRLAQQSAMSSQGSSLYMQKAINAEKIVEMENFLSAIDMISDFLDSDEVDVLEQIARLGTALNYLPGTSRVMALRDMIYASRKDAYRNMIDEILEFGSKNNTANAPEASFEAFGFKYTKAKPLSEVASLLEHLTNTLMGGN